MDKRIIHLIFCSLMLIVLQHNQKIEKIKIPLKYSLSRSYVLGIKKGMPTSLKSAHQILNIQHLLTPSGFHFSIIIWIMGLIKIKRHLVCFSSLILYFINGFHAFRRMGLFYLFYKVKNKYLALILCSLVDLFLSINTPNLISLVLSFLFLGIIFLNIDSPNKEKILWIIISQIIINIIFCNDYSLIGSFFGLIITALFFLIYPVFLLEVIFNFSFLSNFYQQLLIILSKLYIVENSTLSPIILLVFIIIIYYKRSIVIVLFLFSIDIPNINYSSLFKHNFKSSLPPGPVRLKVLDNYQIFYYKGGLSCKRRILLNGWDVRCSK